MLSGPANDYQSASILDTIRHVEENLILDTHGDFWALFRLKGHTYELMSASGKENLHSRLMSALRTMDTHIKLFSLVTEFQPQEYAEQLHARPKNFNLKPPRPAVWDYWCNQLQSSLSGEAPYSREFFISIRLRASSGGLRDGVRQAMRTLTRFVRGMTGRPLLFERRERDAAREASGRMEGRFGPKLIATAATPRDVMWIVRRNAYRAIGEPPVLDGWKAVPYPHPDSPEGRAAEYFQPSVAEHRRLIGDSVTRVFADHVECVHGDGVTSFQRFLAVSNMPEGELSFPDAEWAFVEKPVDLLLDFTVVPPAQAEKERKRQSLTARSQQEYMAEGGAEIPLGLQKAEEANRRLEAEHRSGKPRIDCHATFALAARTLEGLESLTADLLQHYENFSIQLGRAWWTQREAFADWTPVGPTRFTDYRQPISVSALTGGMPVAASALGDNTGFYIGRTVPSGGVVTLDPSLPQRMARSGAITVTGILGGGKSVFMMGETLKWALAGHKALYIDPKGDSDNYAEVPEARGMVEKHTIREGSDTRLPILGVYPLDTDEGRKATHNLLRSFLIELFGVRDRLDYREAVMLGINNLLGQYNPSITGLRDEFWRMRDAYQSYSERIREAAKDAAAQLDLYMQDPLAELVLTDDVYAKEAALSRGNTDYPLTVIDTSGLDLPDREALREGTADEKERISQSMLSVVAASAYQVAHGLKRLRHPPFKAIAFDEAWRFLNSGEGTRLLNALIREGRSKNVTPVVGSQLNADVAPIASLTKIRFMGVAEDEADIRLGLSMMGVDPEQYIIDMVKSFESGDFLHQDIYGQVGAMHHYPVPLRWAEQLGSTPDEREAA